MKAKQSESLPAVFNYVAERTGSALSRHQIARLHEVTARIQGGRTHEAFLQYVKSPEGAAALNELLVAVTVHKTDLFRDDVQIKAVTTHVLKPLANTQKPLRIWSAGCSSGEEVATLLVLLSEVGAHPESTVLGTDISKDIIAKAEKMQYSNAVMQKVPERISRMYFERHGAHHTLRAELRSRAIFRCHNLMDLPYPRPADVEGFHVVFCRNVLIYFSPAAFLQTVTNLKETLVDKGTLVLSAAEPLLNIHAGLETKTADGAFYYQRNTGSNVIAKEMPSPIPNSTPMRPVVRTEPPRPQLTPPAPPVRRSEEKPEDPQYDGVQLFLRSVERLTIPGSDAAVEKGLRQSLYLVPDLAPARYLLAVLLEQKGRTVEAHSEFKRAYVALSQGKSPGVPFYLNNERLLGACQSALERLTGIRME